MKRNKRHKIKMESNENIKTNRSIGSCSQDRDFDLAHYIHDRVELLQRTFEAIKPRELKAMTPACVAGLSLDDLQELCLEELLGISSVRLCAILDGAEPPSDTDSSDSSESTPAAHLETISLDSISSDEDTLNPPPVSPLHESRSGKHKKRCRHKEARKAKMEAGNDESQSRSRTAERAGMTVLELLELQARARAIRAQLAMEHSHTTTTDMTMRKGGHESDNDVQIKEEPPEVVELSSDDEVQKHTVQLPIVNDMQKDKSNTSRLQSSSPEKAQSKNKCDLTVIVPNTQSRKIKLKRNKSSTPANQEPTDSQKNDIHVNTISQMKVTEPISGDTLSKLKGNEIHNDKIGEKESHNSNKNKVRLSKQKKRKRQRNKTGKNREGSDHDEITLQLSDTEKMDLLEDLDRKKLDNLSSSESDTSTDVGVSTETPITIGSSEMDDYNGKCNKQLGSHTDDPEHTGLNNSNENSYQALILVAQNADELGTNLLLQNKDVKPCEEPLNKEKAQLQVCIDENKVKETECGSSNVEGQDNDLKELGNVCDNQVLKDQNQENSQANDISEGEISDRSTSEIKTTVIDPPVSIDCETFIDKQEMLDSNEKSKELKSNEKSTSSCIDASKQTIFGDVCEILEISDDSSCYEEEGESVLSKEPTTEEIEAFSAKIDHEIQREELTTVEDDNKNLENISWKHRYLDSKKVKKIMSTANILNALRKKNKELKRKIEQSRNKTDSEDVNEAKESPVEEGTVDQYNTLEGSTKYVSPPPVSVTTDENTKHLHKEMKKDAKQLLKMYKRLLKYNDMQKEPRKHKSKKKKNKKEKEKSSSELSK